MGEPDSALTFAQLQTEVAEAMGIAYYGAAGTSVAAPPNDARDLDLVKRIINNGIRMFISNAPRSGWNWLQPKASVSIWPTVSVDSTITATGVYDSSTYTDITASEAIFYPEMELHDIVVTDSGTYEIVEYVSTTAIKILGDNAFTSKTFSIAADGHYTLPQSFVGKYTGDIEFAASSGRGSGITWTSAQDIRHRRTISDSTVGPPRWATIMKTTTARRWELIMFPTAGSLETVEFEYDIHFDLLSAAGDLHPAGVQFDDAVRAACLARAEMDHAELLTGRIDYYHKIALQDAWQTDARSRPRKVRSWRRPSKQIVPGYRRSDVEVLYP